MAATDAIVSCPTCGRLARVPPPFPTEGREIRQWSDAKTAAPAASRSPLITRCPSCHEFYWIADAETVGRVPAERGGSPEEWAEAAPVRELDEREYYEAIEEGLCGDAEREHALRLLAWWRSNDRWRDREPAGAKLRPADYDENLLRLAGILETGGDNDRLLRAEVLRELGRHEEALDALPASAPEGLEPVARMIRLLAEARDPFVREIPIER